MIKLIIAVGVEGEFGSSTSKTGLPWNCPEDLESLFYNVQGSDTLLVGAGTWFRLPGKAKERLIGSLDKGTKTPSIHIFDPKNKYELEAVAEMERWGSVASIAMLPSIRALSYSRITKDSIVSCIGGLTLARHLLSEDLIDVAIVNRIRVCETHPEFLAESVSKNTLEAEIEAFKSRLGTEGVNRVQRELEGASEFPYNTLELSNDAIKYHKLINERTLYKKAKAKFINADVFFKEFSVSKMKDTKATVYLNPNGNSLPSEDNPVYFTSELWIFK